MDNYTKGKNHAGTVGKNKKFQDKTVLNMGIASIRGGSERKKQRAGQRGNDMHSRVAGEINPALKTLNPWNTAATTNHHTCLSPKCQSTFCTSPAISLPVRVSESQVSLALPQPSIIMDSFLIWTFCQYDSHFKHLSVKLVLSELQPPTWVPNHHPRYPSPWALQPL